MTLAIKIATEAQYHSLVELVTYASAAGFIPAATVRPLSNDSLSIELAEDIYQSPTLRTGLCSAETGLNEDREDSLAQYNREEQAQMIQLAGEEAPEPPSPENRRVRLNEIFHGLVRERFTRSDYGYRRRDRGHYDARDFDTPGDRRDRYSTDRRTSVHNGQAELTNLFADLTQYNGVTALLHITADGNNSIGIGATEDLTALRALHSASVAERLLTKPISQIAQPTTIA